ncbi:hypothetical protein UNDKW_3761 [Undibacterium sp. KW1]|uniref:hypothetical protein n=1 Tax=Undibacterium sp. KW1 TaxID=2058624 RepID=UPI001331D470|nr:hypothetical protein [Undibacterium sp. KW1]BBB62034.1 hypothetical protein UNDKW_3761 [Undibacterium sp. KW1]
MSSRHVNLDSKNRKQANAGEATGRGVDGSAQAARVKNNEALLPHERDQTTDGKTVPRKVMKQALIDLQEGKVDTDMHGARGVESVVRPVATAAPKP